MREPKPVGEPVNPCVHEYVEQEDWLGRLVREGGGSVEFFSRQQVEVARREGFEEGVAREREEQSVDAAAFRLLRDEADAADAWHAETGMKVARPPHMSPATVKHIRNAEIRARSAKGV